MRKLPVYALLVWAVLPCWTSAGHADSTPGMDQWLGWVLIPGKQAGPIDGSTSEADLVQIYGMRFVVQKGPTWDNAGLPVHQEPATLLFPGDVGRCAEITWNDPDTRQHPKEITLCCSRCYWRTAEGITIGTEARRLEKLNGAGVTFRGFTDTDGGQIQSWNGGHLEESLPMSQASVALDYHREIKLLPADQAALADAHLLESEDPTARKVYPYVSALSVSLQTPADEIAKK